MFGFPVYPEFARALKPGGELLMVEAGPAHLRELREITYPSLKPPRESGGHAPESFVRCSSEALHYVIDLDGVGQVSDLLAMTPHLRQPDVGEYPIDEDDRFDCPVDRRLTSLHQEVSIPAVGMYWPLKGWRPVAVHPLYEKRLGPMVRGAAPF